MGVEADTWWRGVDVVIESGGAPERGIGGAEEGVYEGAIVV